MQQTSTARTPRRWRAFRRSPLLALLTFSGCATTLPPPSVQPPQLPPPPPAALMQSAQPSSQDYSTKVSAWLKKVEAALKNLPSR